jgi:signal transduction histidine kinase
MGRGGCATIALMAVVHRLGYTRSASDRMVAGVAGGIAARLGIEGAVVRLSLVVLAFAGGFGVIVYLIAWVVGGEPRDTDEVARPRTSTRQVIAVGMVVAGALLLLRAAGLWLGDGLMWSLGLSAFGSAILWTQSDDVGRARLSRLTSRIPRTPADALTDRSRTRLITGAALVIAGMSTLLATSTSLSAIGSVAFAVAVTVSGLGLILGPWIYDLLSQLSAERRERIRSEERAEVAAHLHDSALQTLAMIQRASTAQEMTSLARVQERELRAWLYGRTNSSETLRAALDDMAAKIERVYRVAVETVVVGDVPMDDPLRAMVDAAGEATTNAAKHAGVGRIAVFAEATDDAVTVYVRDEGRGFDPANVPVERQGIAQSIRARMERNGGEASVTSTPSQGTEVRLVIGRRAT